MGVGKAGADAVERQYFVLRLERRRAAAYGHHLDGVFAHDENAARGVGVEGQQLALVLQQHDAFLGDAQGGGIVSLGAEEALRLVAVHGGTIEQAQHAAHLLVELAGGVLALLDERLVGLGHVVEVIGIGLAHGQPVGPGAELEVEPVDDGLLGVVAAAPVADDNAVELPLALEYLVERGGVMAVVLVLIEVVGAHDAPGSALLDGSLEGGQIDFVEGAVADHYIHLVAILLVVVEAVVLHAAGNALRLQSLDIGDDHARGEVGVFAHVLEVAAAQRRAEDVDAGAQDDAFVAIECLFAQALAVEARHGGVPCGCEAGEGGEGHARVVGLAGLPPLVP